MSDIHMTIINVILIDIVVLSAIGLIRLFCDIIKISMLIHLKRKVFNAIFVYNLYQSTHDTGLPDICYSHIKQDVTLKNMILYRYKSIVPQDVYEKIEPYIN